MKARAELNSAAFSEMLGAADGKARQNKANPLSRITAQTMQNVTALFASAAKAAPTHPRQPVRSRSNSGRRWRKAQSCCKRERTICGRRCNCTIRARRSACRRCSSSDEEAERPTGGAPVRTERAF
ncbi:hypothetical protein M8494_36920 [Serratia ureilytica]